MPEFALSIAPDTPELPRERLTGDTNCRLYPPHIGEVEVSAFWRPDTGIGSFPSEIDWRFRPDAYGGGLEGRLDDSRQVLRVDSAEVSDGVSLLFETVDELENGDWHITGVIELTPRWVTGFEDPQLDAEAERIMAAQRVSVRVDQEYVARVNSAAAWRLTLLLIVLSAIVSYVLFCWALASNATLPDPNNFWVHHAMVPVVASQGGRLEFDRGAGAAVSSMQTGRVDGRLAGRKRWKQWTARGAHGIDPLEVRLRRAPMLWLPGLLRAAWSEVRDASPDAAAVAASPPGRRAARRSRSASARAQFERLDVVGAAQRRSDGELMAPLWVLRPKHHRGEVVTDRELRSLANLLNDAHARGGSDDVGTRTASTAPPDPDTSPPEPPAESGPFSPPEFPSADPPAVPPPNRSGPPPNRNSGPSR